MAFRNPITAVSVTGTVSTSVASPAGPVIRDKSQTQRSGSDSFMTITTPPTTVAGDLLVLFADEPSQQTLPAGFTPVAYFTGNAITVNVGTRTATAADANGAASYSVSGVSSSGAAGMVMYAISNASKLTVGPTVITDTTNTTSKTVSLGAIAAPALALLATSSSNQNGSATFSWPSSGGPPSPPTIAGDAGFGTYSPASGAYHQHFAVTWASGTYAIQLNSPTPVNGSVYGGIYVVT